MIKNLRTRFFERTWIIDKKILFSLKIRWKIDLQYEFLKFFKTFVGKTFFRERLYLFYIIEKGKLYPAFFFQTFPQFAKIINPDFIFHRKTR